MKKRLVFILAGLLLLSSAIFAASFRKNITVDYMGIKLVVDGREVVMGNDMAGNKIEPFAYEGTTYLPVRAITEALGKTVQWDEATNTVFIGDGEITPAQGSAVDLLEITSPFSIDHASVKSNYSLAAVEYKNAINFKSYLYKQGHANFNLEGKYTNLTAKLGSDQEGTTIRFDFIADGRLLQSYDVISGQLPIDVNLNVSGVRLLEIKYEVTSKNNDSDTGLADIMVR